MTDPETRLAAMLAEFTPDIAALGAAAIARMRGRLPTATVMVYDNYNALAVGFAPGDRPSEAIVSIAVFPRTVSLFFLRHGTTLPDPGGRLRGTGTRARHIPLTAVATLDEPEVVALLDLTLARADPPLPVAGAGVMVIRSVSARRRPRRPGG